MKKCMQQLVSRLFVLIYLFCTPCLLSDANQDRLGRMLATCYLQQVKKIKSSSAYDDESPEQKIFDKKGLACHVSLHDVELSLNKKEDADNTQIVITAQVTGLPEEFEAKHVLENEKALLKYRLIYAYVNRKTQLQARSFAWLRSDDWTLDSATQVISMPEAYKEYSVRRMAWCVYVDKHVMKIQANFTADDFNKLIEKCFGNKVTLQQNKS